MTSPAVSPDGKTIVYGFYGGWTPPYYVMSVPADGSSEPMKLTREPEFAFAPRDRSRQRQRHARLRRGRQQEKTGFAAPDARFRVGGKDDRAHVRARAVARVGRQFEHGFAVAAFHGERARAVLHAHAERARRHHAQGETGRHAHVAVQIFGIAPGDAGTDGVFPPTDGWRQARLFGAAADAQEFAGAERHALAQIDGKGYAIPFSADGRRLTKCGVTVSSAARNLTHWRAVDADGHVIDEQRF